MMGNPKNTQPKLFYHNISLEQRVHKDHPLRAIKQLIDFTYIRSQVADLYGTNGNPSVDPAVILKLMFLLFYENVKSERALMRQMPVRLDWLWFCDYDFDDEIPDHSVISKARKRWGPDAFEQFFTNILEQCINAGLIDGETIYIDSSTIDGNADIDKVKPQLRQVCKDLTEKLEDTIEPNEQPHDTDDRQTDDPEKLEKRVNPVDPDARIGRKYGKSTLGYKDHRVVDDKHGIITATITTPANLNDDKVLQQGVETHEANTASKIRTATADKIYGTIENYKFLHSRGARACIPHQKHGIKEVGKFSHEKFRYDQKQDCYICPAGEKLERYDHTGTHGSGHRYRAKRETCEQCKFFSKCVSSKQHGRQISRNIDAEYVEWADGCFKGYQRKTLLSRRQYKSEGSFADAANNYGFKRARWRGIAKMRIQNLMIAAIQNIGKLLRYGSDKGSRNTSAVSKQAIFVVAEAVFIRLSSFCAACERIFNYQRANPAYAGKFCCEQKFRPK
jgi:transposase